MDRPAAPRALDLPASTSASWRASSPGCAAPSASATSPASSSCSAIVDGSWATAEELRAAIFRLRRAKKHVYVYIAETNTRGYYVACAAERIFQDPAGGIRLVGLSSTTMFFRGLGDLLGVRADFVKIAEYKSAPEQYTRTGSTEPARAEREAYVGDVWAHLVDGIAAARHVAAAAVRAWIDRGPYTAVEAKSAGLVDELRHGDEVEGAIDELPRPARRAAAPRRRRPSATNDWERPAVAVLFVDGDIIDGKSATIPILGMKFAGMQTLMAAHRSAPATTRASAPSSCASTRPAAPRSPPT